MTSGITMRNEILKLKESKPKQYVMMVKNNPILANWVLSNMQTVSDHWPTRIWSALNDSPTICKNGNEQVYDRNNKGLKFCNNLCACAQESRSKNTSKTKLNETVERKKEIRTKRETTMEERFGVKTSFDRPEVLAKISAPKISEQVFAKLSDYNWCYTEYEIKKRSLVDIADELGIFYGTVASYLEKHNFTIRSHSNFSRAEKSLLTFVENLVPNVLSNDREMLNGLELDVLIPDLKIAFELNGLYWHSLNEISDKIIENRNRHLNKTIKMNEQGYELIHITDLEWNNDRSKIENMIRSKLNLNVNKFQARKLTLKNVDRKSEKEFLEHYHLQGFTNSKICLGLYNGDTLLSIASFGKPRFNKKYDWELLRFCVADGCSIAGGLSRLVKNFIKDNPGRLISYCDRMKSNGSSYIAAGFKLVNSTNPGYYWTNGNEIINRLKTTHTELNKWLPTYDNSLSQVENMFANRFRRFWDCGQLVFEIE
jgi:hypothetical protein